MTSHPQEVQWLLEERAVHVQAGRELHIRLVDQELAARGYKEDKPEPAPPAPERADLPSPPENTAEPPPRRRGNTCETCGRNFKTPAALGSHARSHK